MRERIRIPTLKIVLGLPIEHKGIPVDPKLYDGDVGNYEMAGFRMTSAVRDQRTALKSETTILLSLLSV